MILIGEKVMVAGAAQIIKDFLSIPSNLEHLLPMDKVKDFKSDDKTCSFKVQGGFVISLVQDGTDEDKVFLKSGEKSPFPFQLTIFLKEKNTNETEVHIEFDGEVNAFLKMMVEKPLMSLFNYMSNKLSKHYDK
jgi:carbon monoxide dehydrogenase subunit G